jgi:hypothetical protein
LGDPRGRVVFGSIPISSHATHYSVGSTNVDNTNDLAYDWPYQRWYHQQTGVSSVTTTDLRSLSDHVQHFNDWLAIADLITRLGLMLDEKRYDEAPAILAADVTVHTPAGSAQGPDAVVAHARRNHTVRTQHVITGVMIDLHGERAEARANLLVVFVPDSDQPESRLVIGNVEQPESRLMLGERYRFEAVRGEAGWRLRTIEAIRLWSTQPVPTGAVVAQNVGSPAATLAA